MHSDQAGRERGDRAILSRLGSLLRGLLALTLCLAAVLSTAVLWIPASPVRADSQPVARAYRCDGEPLSALLVPGAVDATDIPNTLAGTLPGAYVDLRSEEGSGPSRLRRGKARTRSWLRVDRSGAGLWVDLRGHGGAVQDSPQLRGGDIPVLRTWPDVYRRDADGMGLGRAPSGNTHLVPSS